MRGLIATRNCLDAIIAFIIGCLTAPATLSLSFAALWAILFGFIGLITSILLDAISFLIEHKEKRDVH